MEVSFKKRYDIGLGGFIETVLTITLLQKVFVLWDILVVNQTR